MTKISKPNALVVGASSGVGAQIAKKLSCDFDFFVTCAARRIDRLEEIRKTNININPVRCDVTSHSDIENLFESAISKNGKIKYLFYCAGAQSIKPLRRVALTQVDDLFRVNINGAFYCGKYFCSNKYSENNAIFCAVSSISSFRPEKGISVYSAAKAGLNSLVKSIALEGAPRRAFAIAPGWMDSEMTQKFGTIYDAEFKRTLAEKTPSSIVNIDEVANLACACISDKFSSLNGTVITCDGGVSL